MLDDGLYGLDYRAEYLGEEDGGSALAVLRDGQILGSDPWGGVFSGSYAYIAGAQRSEVRLTMAVPPDEMLITGFSAGPDGASVDIVASFERPAPSAAAVAEVGGRPVAVKLTYLGPLHV